MCHNSLANIADLALLGADVALAALILNELRRAKETHLRRQRRVAGRAPSERYQGNWHTEGNCEKIAGHITLGANNDQRIFGQVPSRKTRPGHMS